MQSYIIKGDFKQVKQDRIDLSIKYQVLSNDTAMIGNVKEI